jgi:hypothetical protein
LPLLLFKQPAPRWYNPPQLKEEAMPFRTRLLLVLIPLLLTASLAWASPAAPETPQAPAATAGQPLAALFPAAPLCAGADLPAFSPAPQTAAADSCGPCSDTACVGKTLNAVCGVGFRCIATGTCSTAAAIRRCQCLII